MPATLYWLYTMAEAKAAREREKERSEATQPESE